MIDWVFLDVGNVLFNDDPQNYQAYRFVYEAIRGRHPDYSFDAMLAEREAWAKTGADFILSKIVRPLLPPAEGKAIFTPLREHLIETYDRNNLLNDGAVEVLKELRSRWRLGDHRQPAPGMPAVPRTPRAAPVFRRRRHQRRIGAAQARPAALSMGHRPIRLRPVARP